MDELKEQGIRPDQILYINFENLAFSNIKNELDLNEFVLKNVNTAGMVYLFFDEIQNVLNFEKALNSFRSTLKCSIFVTGSNGSLLSGELATYLSGRYVSFQVFPFSFSEHCEFLNLSKSEITDSALLSYLEWGGMPQQYSFASKDQQRVFLTDLYNSIVLKDIVTRGKIRNVDLLNKIVDYLANSIGQLFSKDSIIRFLRNERRSLSNDTLYYYIDLITNAYILNRVSRFDIKGKEILSTLDKYYLSDLGIGNIRSYSNKIQINQALENVVYNELVIQDFKVHIGKIDQSEIDFVAEKNKNIFYIQVAYLLAEERTTEREFGIFRRIDDNYQKIVITMDHADFSRNGIKHYNVIDFLINKPIY